MSATRGFVGREALLRTLADHLNTVRTEGRGRILAIRGRRQVGKSRLVEVFVEQASARAAFHQASGIPTAGAELELFSAQIARSTLSAAELAGEGFSSWTAALTTVAEAAPDDEPSILVIDEFPYLVGTVPGIEGTVQQVWDRHLERKPVLLVLIGSDLAMMEALTTHGRPLYQRAREMVVPPFNPAELGAMTGLAPAEALDAHLVVGGFPRLARSWRRGQNVMDHLASALADPMSPLIVTGERMLAGEFPGEVSARRVLLAIGSGESSFTRIRDRAGVNAAVLSRGLAVLVEQKQVVAVDRPISVPGRHRDPRYRVADPYLRFWIRFILPSIDLVARGRDDLALRGISASWDAYRGRAIEPLVREAVQRLVPDSRLGGAEMVGGYWTRTNDVDVDLVGAHPAGRPAALDFVGSIKWRDAGPFNDADAGELAQLAALVPGAHGATRWVGVSRSGFATSRLSTMLGPEELVCAWRRPLAG